MKIEKLLVTCDLPTLDCTTADDGMVEAVAQAVEGPFTEEVLQKNDGKTVPIVLVKGEPPIGEGSLVWDADGKVLKIRFAKEDLNVTEDFKESLPNIFG